MKTMQAMQSLRAARKQKGFTIIELVVVILLLGILAATALPRFMDVTDEAHEAVVDATRSGLQTGVAMYHAQWVGKGEPVTAAGVGYGESVLIPNSDGYPGSHNTLTGSDFCEAIYEDVLQAGRPEATNTDFALQPAVSGTNGDTESYLQFSFDLTPANLAGVAAPVSFIAVMGNSNDTYYCQDDAGTPGTCMAGTYSSDILLNTDIGDGTVAPTLALDTDVCSYYYVGQSKTEGAGNIPVLTLNLTNGEVTEGTFAL